MKLLSIGNSFSQDAQAYLHDLAASGGHDLYAANLMIGGCSLERHWQNIENDAPDYGFEVNGGQPQRNISIREALGLVRWDAVTLQQASHYSGLPETYEPYLHSISAYVKEQAPGARQWIHQTWAYETDSTHGEFPRYGRDQKRMYDALTAAYGAASKAIGARLIPSGLVIQTLRGLPPFDYAHGGSSLCRDGFHMNIPYGRYAVAATWYETLLGADVRENPYAPPGAEDRALLTLIRRTVHAVCAR